MLELVESLADLAEPGAWVRVTLRLSYPSVDEILPLMATGGSCLIWMFRSSAVTLTCSGA